MLKREAQENENVEFEQQAQQFFNSIESNMSTLVTQQPMEVETAVENTPTEAVAEIAAEEPPNQYRVVLGTSSGDSQPVTLSLQVRKFATNTMRLKD
jgi:carbamoylphosphate synthase large subunit